MKRIILILLFISSSSFAVKPVDGFWWNPAESGRGITIEVSNGVLVATLYAYDDNNIGRWYLGAGSFDYNTGVATGTWSAYDGGQCAGCTYTSPSINNSASLGSFTITFYTDSRATMNWAGGTMNLNKFDFTFPDANSFLYGVWTGTMLYSYDAFSETFILDDNFINEGTEYVTGYLWGSNIDTRPAIASVADIDSNGDYIYGILLDTSTSFYKFYLVRANKGVMIGLGWLYLKEDSPTGDGYTLAGQKILELTPPESTNTNNLDKSKNDEYYSKQYQSQILKGQFDKKYIPIVENLERQLKEIKSSNKINSSSH